ncbi:MAG: APC family permease [Pyrinomonadaceae bacterium]
MWRSVKRALVGDPISSEQAHQERLNKKTALAVFSSDALSSVAYSTEAILLVLLAAGSVAIGYLVPIVVGITILLAILTLSYRQTIHAYPSGGGAYIVAKDNLGAQPGLVAGAALLVDYILTVAVSVSAGVAAITSAAQGTRLDFLYGHRVALCIGIVVFIALVNLRGVRESGAIFAGPTYLFILSMVALVVVGFIRYYATGDTMPTPPAAAVAHDPSVGMLGPGALTGGALVWLLMRAFAAGCTALTGVEAISNGIPAFRKPESANAAATLTSMAIIMTTLILGTGFLAYKLHAHPSSGGEETLVSLMARHTFGTGVFYYFIQAATAGILVLAANTSFADFPRLASLLAADRYLPRQFANRGDRLVFSNGIVILAVLAIVLIIIFKGQEQAMLPLYAVGVFLSFTLSQTGMVIHWLRERDREATRKRILKQEEEESIHRTVDPSAATHARERLRALDRDKGGHWFTATLVNGAGACITFVVLIVITVTKFTHGAWAVIVLIPLLVVLFRAINGHYMLVAAQLRLNGTSPSRPLMRHRIIIPVSGIHRGVLPAIDYARSLAGDGHDITAVYVEINPENTEEVRRQWQVWGGGLPLTILRSPFRSITTPLINFINEESCRQRDSVTTIVLPEFVPRAWWQQLLHNQTALLLKGKLLFARNIVVTSVPHHLRR